jgi:hypothetical protein
MAIDLEHTRTATKSPLWIGAGLTAAAALLLPRMNAVLYDHEKIWHLDSEARVLAPLVVVVTVALFAAVGLPLWHRRGLATGSLVVGVVSIIAVVAYWMSLPIALGGLAVTLGLESVNRDDARVRARVGMALGALGILAGAVLWLTNL